MERSAKLSKLEGGEVADSNIYRSMIKSLRYLTCIRPNITFIVGVASRFMENPRYPHMKSVKRIIKYIKKTEDLELFYRKTNKFKLIGFEDSDWYSDINYHKDTSGYAFFIEDTTLT
jgi:hypothetical protein